MILSSRQTSRSQAAAVAVAVSIFCSIIPHAALSQPQEIIDQFQERTHTHRTTTLPYRLFVPVDYDSLQVYPVILTLHGLGQGPLATAWAEPEAQAKWPSFVVAPQGNRGWDSGELETAVDILDSLATEFSIDQDRLYVTGLSAGGFGTFNAILDFPNRFAAAIPMSGGWKKPGELGRRERLNAADAMGDISLWVVHGEIDALIDAEASRVMVSAFEELGRNSVYTHCGPLDRSVDCLVMSPGAIDSALAARPNLLYTGYPGEGHSRSLWVKSYDDPRIQRWMLEQFRLDPAAIEITAPTDYSTFFGIATIEWVAKNPADTVEVWFSPDLGSSWVLLVSDVITSGAYEFDTSALRETAFGRVRILVRNERGFIYGREESEGFIIDHPGDGAPQLDLPDFDFRVRDGFETEKREYALNLRVADTESASLTTAIRYSSDGGDTFEPVEVVELQAGTSVQQIPIAMEALANSERAVFSVVVSDGVSETSDETPEFRKATPRWEGVFAEQVAGPSGTRIEVNVVSPSLLTGRLYRVSFGTPTQGVKTFTVTDLDLEEVVLSSIPLTGAESPPFDGIRLRIDDRAKARVDPEKTLWSTGTATVNVAVRALDVTFGGEQVDLLATPTDYRIVMLENVQGNSSALFGFPEKPIRFTVENLKLGAYRQILFEDPDGNGYPSRGEPFYILEPDDNAVLQPAWWLAAWGDAKTVQPTAGDVLEVVTIKPLTEEDVYEFRGVLAATASESEYPSDGFKLSGNYPNPFARTTTIPYSLGTAGSVTVTIHDILGRRVALLTPGYQQGGDHQVVWDGLSSTGARLTSGVYLYTMSTTAVDRGALRQLTRRMSIVR